MERRWKPRVALTIQGEKGNGSLHEYHGARGIVVIELFVEEEPQLAENFRLLCTGETMQNKASYQACGLTSEVPIKGKYVRFTSTAMDALGNGEGLRIQDGAHVPNHNAAGLLTMLLEEHNSNNNMDTEEACANPTSLVYRSTFAITLGPHGDVLQRSGARVFGRVLRGMALLREAEREAAVLNVSHTRELEEGDDGEILWPDGDPFPRWPHDAPQMREREHFANRCAAAETIKAYGSEAFANGDIALADAKYTKALRYLDKRFTRDADVYEQEMRERFMQARAKVPLLLNAALCKIKLGEARAAIAHCNEAHTWLQTQASLDAQAAAVGARTGAANAGQERRSPKLLLRRGIARAMCREYDAALDDLKLAAALLPKDATIRRELERVQVAAKEHMKKKRNAYAKMFG